LGNAGRGSGLTLMGGRMLGAGGVSGLLDDAVGGACDGAGGGIGTGSTATLVVA
jgi:hypothetical protein